MADQNQIPSNLPIAKDSDIPKVKPSLPPLPTPPVNQLSATRPTPPATPSSQTPPTTPTPKIPPAVKSFIRTMEGDIKSLKQGAEPKGVEVTVPKSSTLPSLPQAQMTAPTTVKPIAPAPTVRIGEAEKSQTLPGIKPPLPITRPQTDQSKTIVVPPKKAGFLSRPLIISVVVILLAVGGGYWFFVLKQQPEPVATTTFTPRPTPTPDPLKPLKNLFSLSNQVSLSDSVSLSDLAPLHSAISAAVTDSQVKNIFVAPESEANGPISFSEFTKRFLANKAGPGSDSETLVSSIYNENFGLIFSLQEEKFDNDGKPVFNAPAERRLALIAEVSDLSGAQSALSSWESNLPSDIKDLFELSDKTNSQVFQDNNYREVSIRFINFPNPDRSIDYAFVRSVNDKQYLVIANSRAQIYSIIDTLLGF